MSRKHLDGIAPWPLSRLVLSSFLLESESAKCEVHGCHSHLNMTQAKNGNQQGHVATRLCLDTSHMCFLSTNDLNRTFKVDGERV